MKLLLDTNILLPIANDEVETLNRQLRDIITEPTSLLYCSVASIWEIAIKWRLGKLKLDGPPEKLPSVLRSAGISMIDVVADHALFELDPLPDTRDPFDRLMLGICAVEGTRLVTTDRALLKHPLAWRAG